MLADPSIRDARAWSTDVRGAEQTRAACGVRGAPARGLCRPSTAAVSRRRGDGVLCARVVTRRRGGPRCWRGTRRPPRACRRAAARSTHTTFAGIICRRLASVWPLLVQADVDAQHLARPDRRDAGSSMRSPVDADVFRLPAEVARRRRLEDLDRTVLPDAQPAAALGAVGVVVASVSVVSSVRSTAAWRRPTFLKLSPTPVHPSYRNSPAGTWRNLSRCPCGVIGRTRPHLHARRDGCGVSARTSRPLAPRRPDRSPRNIPPYALQLHGHREEVAAVLAGEQDLPRPRPARRRRDAQGVRAGHVPLPQRRRAARRPPRGVHRHRHRQPLPADEGRTTSCTRWAGTRSACPPSSTRSRPTRTRADDDAEEHRELPPADPDARPELRLGPRGRHDRPELLQVDAVDLPAAVQQLLRPDRPEGQADRAPDATSW